MIIHYSFVPMGTVVSPQQKNEKMQPQRNRIFLDVGNALQAGVIDTHHLPDGVSVGKKRFISATGVVTTFPSLVLDNIDNEATEVEIVIHQHPDLDCFASAYLARYLIETGDLPPKSIYEPLIDYVEEVDSGRLIIDGNNLCTAAPISYAIEEIIKSRQPYISADNLNQLTLGRGLELVDYIIQRLETLLPGERNLFHPGLFSAQNPFSEEISLVIKDYEQYKKEVEDKSLCEIRTVRLPLISRTDNCLEEVDGLFWYHPPGCLLHKHWARQDLDYSPGRQGFILTFIPGSRTPVNLLERNICLPGNQIEQEVNQVIISVNPNSNVCLRGLAEKLEFAECQAELNRFGEERRQMWRNRNPRFPESWCDNADPWYDGRAFSYTIVDAPGIGSLLSVEEIRNITLDFTSPRINKHICRMVIPFEFSHQLYGDMVNWVKKNAPTGTDNSPGDHSFFLPYVEDYLFRTTRGRDSLPHHIQVDLDDRYLEEYLEKQPVWAVEAERMQETFNRKKQMELRVSRCLALMFRYGIGYLVLDIEPQLKYPELLQECMLFNRSLAEQGERIFAYVSQEDFFATIQLTAEKKNSDICLATVLHRRNKKAVGKGCEDYYTVFPPRICGESMIFTAMEADKASIFNSEKKEIMFKLANVMIWDESYSRSRYVEGLLEKMVLEIDEYALYGFSKSGGALVVICDDISRSQPLYQQQMAEMRRQDLLNSFMDIDFWMFMLALHQRHVLTRFSNDLAVYVNINNKRKIGELRCNLLDFTTVAWFSQITNNEMGMEIYRHWQDIFETSQLYDEVFVELCAVDEVKRSRTTSKYEKISILVLPAVVFGTIFGMNIEELAGISIMSPTGIECIIGLVIVTIGYWVYLSRD